MPLALLLQQQLGIVVKGVDEKLRHWDEAMERIALVAERLRSGYLVHWFGTALPSVGIALRVALANMDELRARWLAVGGPQAGATAPAGPNLLEPLLGAGGTLAGTLATPLNGILLTTAIGSLVDGFSAKALAVVNWLTAGLLVTAALTLGAVAPLGLVGVAIGGQARELYDFLGAAAELAEPLQRFWQQVTGPRDAVRNPLLRELLLLGDRAAALVASLLGTFAVLVTRVGPYLEPLRLGLVAVAGLVLDLWPVIVLAATQTVEVLTGLVAGPTSVPALLRQVVAILSGSLRRIGARFAATFDAIRLQLAFRTLVGEILLDWWWLGAEEAVRAFTSDHPTVRYLRAFAGELGVVSTWRGRDAGSAGSGGSKSSSSSGGPSGLTAALGAALRAAGMPAGAPKLPTLPKLPPLVPLGSIGPIVDVLGLLRSLGFGVGPANPLEPGDEARRVLERAARPPSVFGAEWRALEAEARRPEPLARTLEVATYLSLARRVVGPAATAGVRGLEDVLSRIDAVIRTERQRLPVKDVPEPTRLAPVVRRLRVTSRGRTAEALQAFVADLRRELDAGDYAVPVGG